jgi:hemoglobin-like flavoprotein
MFSRPHLFFLMISWAQFCGLGLYGDYGVLLDKRLLEETWVKILDKNDFFTKIFYEKFFHMAPHARKMFPEDMKTQEFILFLMLEFLIYKYDSGDGQMSLDELAALHGRRGVSKEDFKCFGKALLSSIEDVLQGDLTVEEQSAWQEFYNKISSHIISGIDL